MPPTPTDNGRNQQSTPQRGSAQRFARGLAILGVILLIPLTTVRFMIADWPLELLSHFQFQYWIASIVTIPVAVVARSWRLTVLALIPLLVTTFALLPYWIPGGSPPAIDAINTVTIFHANVLTKNRQHQLVLEVIEQHDPDIIVLQEVDGTWLTALAPLRNEYPYALQSPRDDNFGIAVFSRLPFQASSIESFGVFQLPWCKFTVAAARGLIDIIAIHPLPPMRSASARDRNAQLADLADVVARNANPTVVVGDLNVTPWSLHFSRLIAKGGLRDGRKGFGIEPTWPADLPVFFRIPIDHCLVTAEIAIRSFQVGEAIGGDHLPIIVELGRLQRLTPSNWSPYTFSTNGSNAAQHHWKSRSVSDKVMIPSESRMWRHSR